MQLPPEPDDPSVNIRTLCVNKHGGKMDWRFHSVRQQEILVTQKQEWGNPKTWSTSLTSQCLIGHVRVVLQSLPVSEQNKINILWNVIVFLEFEPNGLLKIQITESVWHLSFDKTSRSIPTDDDSAGWDGEAARIDRGSSWDFNDSQTAKQEVTKSVIQNKRGWKRRHFKTLIWWMLT